MVSERGGSESAAAVRVHFCMTGSLQVDNKPPRFSGPDVRSLGMNGVGGPPVHRTRMGSPGRRMTGWSQCSAIFTAGKPDTRDHIRGPGQRPQGFQGRGLPGTLRLRGHLEASTRGHEGRLRRKRRLQRGGLRLGAYGPVPSDPRL